MTLNYLPITDHIYFDGHSFRVRFMKNGKKHSRNFKTKKSALNFKNKKVKN